MSGFRAFSLLGFYVTTMRHTGSYPLRERATTLLKGGIRYGRGWALCLPRYHDTAHRSHRAIVVGRCVRAASAEREWWHNGGWRSR